MLVRSVNRWSVHARTEWSRETNYFHFAYPVRSSDDMEDNGVITVCFRLLRQATHSLSDGETIYREDL